MKPLRRILLLGYLSVFLASALATAYMFPWSVDPQGDASYQPEVRQYYDKAFSSDPATGKDDIYKESAERATILTRTPKIAQTFIDRYGLKDKKILEVGAGGGQLQDMVADYTGLDISRSARRFFPQALRRSVSHPYAVCRQQLRRPLDLSRARAYPQPRARAA